MYKNKKVFIKATLRKRVISVDNINIIPEDSFTP